MARALPPELGDLADVQCGILTARQAADAGFGRGAILSRLRSGRWQQLHRGVYATFSGAPSRAAVLWAAVLAAGDGAVLSHQTAAEVSGLADKPSDLVHVAIPASRRVSRIPGVVIHLSARAADARHPARMPPQTRVEETVLDLAAAAASIDDVVGWVTRALGRRLTTQDKLRHALAQRPKIRWRVELAELLSADQAGLMSALERRWHRHVEAPHGLPRGTRQAPYRRGRHTEYRDVHYQPYATVVELDGNATHDAATRWHDIRRDNNAAAQGLATLRYGWLDTRPPRACQAAAEALRVLRSRGYRGGHPCSPGCPVPAPAPAAGRALPGRRHRAA